MKSCKTIELPVQPLFLLTPEMQEPVAVFLQVETEQSGFGTRNRKKGSTA
jgi:hypothetical protein